jgi:protein-tyrosine phosphatase
MAAALMQHRLGGVDELLPVRSAGLLAEGYDADPHACSAMADLGLDLSSHASRRLDRAVISEATLIVGMERRHVREAVVLVPDAFPRAFTLKELVRRSRSVGARRPGQSVATWLSELSADRAHAELLGESREDDIDDPVGAPAPVFRALASELDHLVTAFADLVRSG